MKRMQCLALRCIAVSLVSTAKSTERFAASGFYTKATKMADGVIAGIYAVSYTPNNFPAMGFLPDFPDAVFAIGPGGYKSYTKTSETLRKEYNESAERPTKAKITCKESKE